MYEKLFFVVLGAVLGKLIDVHLQRRNIDRLQQALLEELEDLKERLTLICRSYERAIQIFALGGVSPDLPLKLANPIYLKHYPEVALRFGASQRKSLSLIHSYVDGVNSGIERLESALSSAIENISDVSIERWGGLLKAQYKNAATAYWHVAYHLTNRNLPILGEEGSEEHAAYIHNLRSMNDHIEKIIVGAREKLTRESFDEIGNETGPDGS